MKKIKSKKYSILINLSKYGIGSIFLFLLVFNITLAVVPGGTVGNNTPGGTVGNGGGATVTTKINNPLGDGNLETIPDFIFKVVEIVLTVGIPVVALAIIYTGFLFVAAQGSPEKLTKAKKALVFTLVGAAILLGAFVIAKAIQALVDELKSSV